MKIAHVYIYIYIHVYIYIYMYIFIYIYTLQVPIENAYVPHHFNMYECIHFLGGYLEGLGRCDVGKLY